MQTGSRAPKIACRPPLMRAPATRRSEAEFTPEEFMAASIEAGTAALAGLGLASLKIVKYT